MWSEVKGSCEVPSPSTLEPPGDESIPDEEVAVCACVCVCMYVFECERVCACMCMCAHTRVQRRRGKERL